MSNTTIKADFTVDDLSPELREFFEFAYNHGFNWALDQGLTRDDAEVYAAARAREGVVSYPNESSHSLAVVPHIATKYPHVK